LHLLHKHGIDLEDGNGIADGTKTKRLDRKEVERLMGGDDDSGGVFTWREKNSRKASFIFIFLKQRIQFTGRLSTASLLGVLSNFFF
jgi:hypothetical protein